jgi:hypothetical protein
VRRSDRPLRRRAWLRVTGVKGATADYSDEMMHAALDINILNYAHAVVTTEEIVASISAANMMETTPT